MAASGDLRGGHDELGSGHLGMRLGRSDPVPRRHQDALAGQQIIL